MFFIKKNKSKLLKKCLDLWYFLSDSIRKRGTIMMRKIKLLSIFVLFSGNLDARWILVSIENKSDLVLLQAAHHNDVEIQSLSSKIKNAHSLEKISLEVDDFFGSVGNCKILGKNPAGQKVTISLFGDPTHRVANGRALFADSASRQAASLIKESMLARVFLTCDDVVALIGYSGYEVDNQGINLVITGSSGNYQAKLFF